MRYGSPSHYLLRDRPGVDQEANWQPEPKGILRFAARFYGPYTPLIDDSFNMLGAVRVD